MTSQPTGPTQPSATRILRWNIWDFKAIADASVRLSPLTILTGANSSGKSSLLQSLLFLAQSGPIEGPVLNGVLAQLGEPEDVIRSGSDSFALGVTFEANINLTEGPPSVVHYEVAFQADGRELRPAAIFMETTDGQHLLTAVSNRIFKADRNGIDATLPSTGTLLRISELNGKRAPAHIYLMVSAAAPDVVIYKQGPEQVLAAYKRTYKQRELVQGGLALQQFLSELNAYSRSAAHDGIELGPLDGILRDFRLRPAKAREHLSRMPSELYVEMLTGLANWVSRSEWVPMPVIRYAPGRRSNTAARANVALAQPTAATENLFPAVPALGVLTELLRSLSQNIYYLGPLREEPSVLSSSRGIRNRALPVGARGELTADLLVRNRAQTIRWQKWDGEPMHSTLNTAVTRWTSYLGIGERVTVLDQGKLGQGLRVLIDGVERDLTTIGVGASQLLPVVVAGLSVPSGAILLLEQPELHLHPAVQSRLADFFLLARPDVKFIVETHSEYLITRIRRRIAEGEASTSQVQVLFAEQSSGTTTIRELEINEYGDLNEWPSGFFDTQDEESRKIIHAIHSRVNPT